MALVFVTQHSLTFSPNKGEDYSWEIDILRSYRNADESGNAINKYTNCG